MSARGQHYFILAVVLACALLLLPGCAKTYESNLIAIDGDTVRAGNERLRLEGIDAPELPTSPRDCQRHHCPAGDPVESRNVLQAMLDMRGAYCTDSRFRGAERDYYGRVLVTCYVGEPGPSRINLNSWMVAHGFAETYQPSRPGG